MMSPTAGINGGLAVWNLLLAYIGSFNAEHAGRRKLWLTSTIGMLVSYIIITALSGSFAADQTRSVGIATVPMLFIYYGFYDIGWTPLPCMLSSVVCSKSRHTNQSQSLTELRFFPIICG